MHLLPGKRAVMVFLAVAAVLLLPLAASATLYGFAAVLNNGANVNTATAPQYKVDVTDPSGDNNVLFTFTNLGPAASSICDVYFADGTLLDMSDISYPTTGVAFSRPATPGEMPGSTFLDPDFITTDPNGKKVAPAAFSADSVPEVQPNGVNPDEALAILFTLLPGMEYNDTLLALKEGTLRIGIHVQGFANGGSESFVNKKLTTVLPPVPVPPTVLLLGSGLVGLALLGWRRRKQ